MADSQSDRPFFSVVMPVYNHAAYVAEAVRSVIKQTFADWQLVVVDDGSKDDSPRIVRELAQNDTRITLIQQVNAGPAVARNAGLERAGGCWLTYIDSDDLWFPDALANYRKFIDEHPDAQFIYGYRHRLDEDGSITELPGEYQDRQTGTAELFQRMYLSHLCVCYRRELLDKAGRYDPNLRSCEDYELYLRISLHCRFAPLGKPTGLRRRHGTNISRQSGFSRMQEAEILRRFVEKYGGAKVLDERAARSRLGKIYYSAGRQYFKAWCFSQAVQAGRIARQFRPSLKNSAVIFFSRLFSPLGKSDGRQMPKL
ncbi:MAG: glycosyltransferase [Planctomycetes bacterium]|nr:glycosyltransferase [Planctomycetota bacterium]